MLGQEWFARPTARVARELLGCMLVVDRGTDDEVRARVVETEAYLGTSDPASHAYRGPTRRAAIMFGPAGRLYVYLSYGVHHCANLVTEVDGTAGAVLLRAASVIDGAATVRRRRGPAVPAEALLRGPGNLCRGLGLSLLDNGTDVAADWRVAVLPPPAPAPVCVSHRVGIAAAADEPLRFAWRGDPAVSRPLPWRQEKGPV